MPLPAGRLLDGAVEALDREQRPHRLRRRGIEICVDVALDTVPGWEGPCGPSALWLPDEDGEVIHDAPPAPAFAWAMARSHRLAIS
jgi:hypothetical protein